MNDEYLIISKEQLVKLMRKIDFHGKTVCGNYSKIFFERNEYPSKM